MSDVEALLDEAGNDEYPDEDGDALYGDEGSKEDLHLDDTVEDLLAEGDLYEEDEEEEALPEQGGDAGLQPQKEEGGAQEKKPSSKPMPAAYYEDTTRSSPADSKYGPESYPQRLGQMGAGHMVGGPHGGSRQFGEGGRNGDMRGGMYSGRDRGGPSRGMGPGPPTLPGPPMGPRGGMGPGQGLGGPGPGMGDGMLRRRGSDFGGPGSMGDGPLPGPPSRHGQLQLPPPPHRPQHPQGPQGVPGPPQRPPTNSWVPGGGQRRVPQGGMPGHPGGMPGPPLNSALPGPPGGPPNLDMPPLEMPCILGDPSLAPNFGFGSEPMPCGFGGGLEGGMPLPGPPRGGAVRGRGRGRGGFTFTRDSGLPNSLPQESDVEGRSGPGRSGFQASQQSFLRGPPSGSGAEGDPSPPLSRPRDPQRPLRPRPHVPPHEAVGIPPYRPPHGSFPEEGWQEGWQDGGYPEGGGAGSTGGEWQYTKPNKWTRSEAGNASAESMGDGAEEGADEGPGLAKRRRASTPIDTIPSSLQQRSSEILPAPSLPPPKTTTPMPGVLNELLEKQEDCIDKLKRIIALKEAMSKKKKEGGTEPGAVATATVKKTAAGGGVARAKSAGVAQGLQQKQIISPPSPESMQAIKRHNQHVRLAQRMGSQAGIQAGIQAGADPKQDAVQESHEASYDDADVPYEDFPSVPNQDPAGHDDSYVPEGLPQGMGGADQIGDADGGGYAEEMYEEEVFLEGGHVEVAGLEVGQARWQPSEGPTRRLDEAQCPLETPTRTLNEGIRAPVEAETRVGAQCLLETPTMTQSEGFGAPVEAETGVEVGAGSEVAGGGGMEVEVEVGVGAEAGPGVQVGEALPWQLPNEVLPQKQAIRCHLSTEISPQKQAFPRQFPKEDLSQVGGKGSDPNPESTANSSKKRFPTRTRHPLEDVLTGLRIIGKGPDPIPESTANSSKKRLPTRALKLIEDVLTGLRLIGKGPDPIPESTANSCKKRLPTRALKLIEDVLTGL
eukprot:gene24361-9974_t